MLLQNKNKQITEKKTKNNRRSLRSRRKRRKGKEVRTREKNGRMGARDEGTPATRDEGTAAGGCKILSG